MIESFAPSIMYPTPTNTRTDDGQTLFKRSIVLSIVLHAALGCSMLTFAYLNNDNASVTIQQINDISIVPLSALETQLQRGSPEKPTQAQPPPPHIPTEQSAVLSITDAPKRTGAQQPPDSTSKSVSKASSRARDTQITKSLTAINSTASQETGLVLNAEGVASEHARINYQDAIATLLGKAKRYPERALKRRITGEATVKIEITADGKVTSARILRSTESEILDEEVLAMVDRASPFPIFPADLKKQSIALVVPIAFALR